MRPVQRFRGAGAVLLPLLSALSLAAQTEKEPYTPFLPEALRTESLRESRRESLRDSGGGKEDKDGVQVFISAAPQDPGEELVSLDFKDVDIKLVIKFISELTGRNFILDDRVRGPVTIISPTRIPVAETFKVLESILDVKGFVAVPSGNLIKIIPKREGMQKEIETRGGDETSDLEEEDKVITQLIPLRYAGAETIRGIIQPLVSKDAAPIAYPDTNTLIITDTASNLRRIMKILNEIDVAGYEPNITVVPLKHAAASTLATEILSVVEQGGAARPATRRGRRGTTATPSSKIKIIPDERTNSLIVVANVRDTEDIKALIEELDTPTPLGIGRTNVYYLKHSDAEEVATVLTNITSKKKVGEAETPPVITAFKAMNALVIDASPQEYLSLMSIIQKLDIARDQVLVELIVAEANLNKSLELGFQFLTLNQVNLSPDYTDPVQAEELFGWSDTQNFGQMNFNNALQGAILDSDGNVRDNPVLSFSQTGGSVGFVYGSDPNSEIPTTAVLLQAFQEDRDFNVLSAPQVLTSDNQEVEFQVVDNIPVRTSTLTTGAGQTGTDTIEQFDYRDVGVKVKLTPHISKNRFVRLEVEQKIDSVVPGTITPGVPSTPITLKRETKTTVNVKDKHTIVISGLLSDARTTRAGRIPILGDLPIAGVLFRDKTDTTEKVNLLVFITPHIVKNPKELEDVTERLRYESKELQRQGQGRKFRLLDEFISKSRYRSFREHKRKKEKG